jgi:uncharacterized protein RhaS with RHS repeats
LEGLREAMNGRLYDPALGRMLSPDNYAHGGTQGENRYSYVLNNPFFATLSIGEGLGERLHRSERGNAVWLVGSDGFITKRRRFGRGSDS